MNNEQEKKDREKTNSISIHHVRYNYFGSNVSAEKAYKRSERIVAALYVLTKYVPDAEPVKCLIRESGHVLLKDIIALRSGFRVHAGAPAILRIHTHIRELITQAQLLAVAGFVSKENADMVTRALEELTQFVESSRGTELSEDIILNKDELLMDGRVYMGRRESAALTSVTEKSHTHQKTNEHKGGGGLSTREKGQGSALGSGRRGAILEVLKGGRRMGIKDIASFVVGCSEKTVQRELASLIAGGLVQKEGEKRWSRYFLIEK